MHSSIKSCCHHVTWSMYRTAAWPDLLLVMRLTAKGLKGVTLPQPIAHAFIYLFLPLSRHLANEAHRGAQPALMRSLLMWSLGCMVLQIAVHD